MKQYFFISFLLIFFSLSCNENELIKEFILIEEYYNDIDLRKSRALIDWTGEYEVDGCGFFFYIGNHEYNKQQEECL